MNAINDAPEWTRNMRRSDAEWKKKNAINRDAFLKV